MGTTPPLRIPPDLNVMDFRSEVHRASLSGVDLYGACTFNDSLKVEHHTENKEPHKVVEVVHTLLLTIPSEDSWMAD